MQLVGKDALAEGDKIVLETARFIKDDYLQQNSFTKYDRYCPFYKSVEMMRNIAAFHRLATAAVEKTAGADASGRVTLALIKQRLGDVLYKLTSQKFEDPGETRTDRVCVLGRGGGRDWETGTERCPGLLARMMRGLPHSLDAAAHRALNSHARPVLTRPIPHTTSPTPPPPSHTPPPYETADGEDAVRGRLRALHDELAERFRALEEEFR